MLGLYNPHYWAWTQLSSGEISTAEQMKLNCLLQKTSMSWNSPTFLAEKAKSSTTIPYLLELQNLLLQFANFQWRKISKNKAASSLLVQGSGQAWHSASSTVLTNFIEGNFTYPDIEAGILQENQDTTCVIDH